MKNPFFDAGGIIGGDRFIGRELEIRQIQDRLCREDGYASAVIIGMPKVGKSSLVQKAIFDNADDLGRKQKLAIRLEVGTFHSFAHLLNGLVRQVMEKLTKYGHNQDAFLKQGKQVLQATANVHWEEVRRFLSHLKKANIRIICALDEFDAGRYLFNGNPQCFHQLRELATNTEFKIGLLLVTKRDLGEISRLAGHSSDYWANVLRDIPLGVFKNDEVDEYFSRLARFKIECNASLKREVIYQSGCHPFVLDQAASSACEAINGKRKFGRKEWLAAISSFMNNLLKQIVGVLQDGTGLNNLNAILLDNNGAVSREDVNSLIRYGLVVNDKKAGKYLPFAPALTEYVQATLSKTHTPLPDSIVTQGNADSLGKTNYFGLDDRLSVSIWTTFISLAFVGQIIVMHYWPACPKPTIIAVCSAAVGAIALTRVGRNFWQKKIGNYLLWLPWVGLLCVVVLSVILVVLTNRKENSTIISSMPKMVGNDNLALSNTPPKIIENWNIVNSNPKPKMEQKERVIFTNLSPSTATNTNK